MGKMKQGNRGKINMKASEIKALRAKLGITQAEIAFKIGVSTRTEQDYEQGRYSPSKAVLINLLNLKKELE